MTTVAEVREVLARVTDPEIPVLTIADLGILRDVRVGQDGHVDVDITPTYSGCPAMDAIRDDVLAALRAAGVEDAAVHLVLAPAWTTDWMTEDGRTKLREYGIAPPGLRTDGPVALALAPTRRVVACPRCGSTDTELLTPFGSTSCQAQWRCRACLEPFDEFKAI